MRMIITLGISPRTPPGFRAAFIKRGSGINDQTVNEVLGGIVATRKKTKQDLLTVKVAELGLIKGAPCEQIYTQAQELGLGLCSAEVGPRLILEKGDQLLSIGNRLIVAMQPIADSKGNLWLLGIEQRNSGRWWLHCYPGSPRYVWPFDTEFVFYQI